MFVVIVFVGVIVDISFVGGGVSGGVGVRVGVFLKKKMCWCAGVYNSGRKSKERSAFIVTRQRSLHFCPDGIGYHHRVLGTVLGVVVGFVAASF